MKKRILLGAFLFAGTAFGFAKNQKVENTAKVAMAKTSFDTCTRYVRYTYTTTTVNSDGSTSTESHTIQYSYQVPCVSLAISPIGQE